MFHMKHIDDILDMTPDERMKYLIELIDHLGTVIAIASEFAPKQTNTPPSASPKTKGVGVK